MTYRPRQRRPSRAARSPTRSPKACSAIATTPRRPWPRPSRASPPTHTVARPVSDPGHRRVDPAHRHRGRRPAGLARPRAGGARTLSSRHRCVAPVENITLRDAPRCPARRDASAQRERALAVVQETLSEAGYRLARDDRTNQVIAKITNRPDEYGEWLYWLSVMGTPSGTEPWGWQIDGHHVVAADLPHRAWPRGASARAARRVTTICPSSSMAASHCRSGLLVGRSPKRITSSGPRSWAGRGRLRRRS